MTQLTVRPVSTSRDWADFARLRKHLSALTGKRIVGKKPDLKYAGLCRSTKDRRLSWPGAGKSR